MYLRWISFICGAWACMFCIEWICFTVNGTSSIRTMIVSPTIDHAHGRPTECSPFRMCLSRCSSGVRMLATIT